MHVYWWGMLAVFVSPLYTSFSSEQAGNSCWPEQRSHQAHGLAQLGFRVWLCGARVLTISLFAAVPKYDKRGNCPEFNVSYNQDSD